jgi:hypothetical protein
MIIAMRRKPRKKKRHNRKTLTGGYKKKFISVEYKPIDGDAVPYTFVNYGIDFRAPIDQFERLDRIISERKESKILSFRFIQGMAMNYGYTLA